MVSEGSLKRVRIVSNGRRDGTGVYDEQGNQMSSVMNVSIDIDPSAPELVTATLDVLAEIDVTCDAEIKRMRKDDDTGAWEEVERTTSAMPTRSEAEDIIVWYAEKTAAVSHSPESLLDFNVAGDDLRALLDRIPWKAEEGD